MAKSSEETPKTTLQRVKKYFKEYCSCTTIHGFQYFGQNRTYAEKFWWLFTFAIILSLCSLCICKIYQKWQQSPVIVSFATKDTPIYQIPFPAVTICPSVKVSNENCLRYSEVALRKSKNKTVTPLEEEIFNTILPLCIEAQEPDQDLPFTVNGNDTITEKYYDILDQCNPFDEFMYARVKWMGQLVETPHDMIKKIITDEGICYTFNILSREHIFKDNVVHYKDFHFINETLEWSFETQQYLDNASAMAYPRRGFFSGATNSLDLVIMSSKDDIDYRCKDIQQGFKVVVHLPSRIPTPREDFMILPFSQASMIAISPEYITTSDRIKSYRPSQRDCYFNADKPLKFFKAYTRKNCALECLTNYTLETCECVSFYMPRENGTPICGPTKMSCVTEALNSYKVFKLIGKMDRDKGQSSAEDQAEKELIHAAVCNCLPLCSDITYGMTVTQVPWDWKQHSRDLGRERVFNESILFTSLTIYFKSNSITTLERNELYGPTDFLSNFGGIIGLFTGFSILSLMEVIYFLTLRILGNVRLFGNWWGPPSN